MFVSRLERVQGNSFDARCRAENEQLLRACSTSERRAKRLRFSLDTAERLWDTDQMLQNVHTLVWAWRSAVIASRAVAVSAESDNLRKQLHQDREAHEVTTRKNVEEMDEFIQQLI